MRQPTQSTHRGLAKSLFWDLLTFDKLMTNQVTHLIYWAGLCVIAVIGFGVVGGAVGLAIREASIMGVLLAIPVLVAGLLVVAVLVLLWRSFCELYVAIFRLSDDLHALRRQAEAEGGVRPPHV
jgi:hypothetical protein